MGDRHSLLRPGSPPQPHGTAPPGRHADGNGLYLFVQPSSTRSWIQRLVIRGRRREIELGSIALVSLAEAREKARANRKLARADGDTPAAAALLCQAACSAGVTRAATMTVRRSAMSAPERGSGGGAPCPPAASAAARAAGGSKGGAASPWPDRNVQHCVGWLTHRNRPPAVARATPGIPRGGEPSSAAVRAADQRIDPASGSRGHAARVKGGGLQAPHHDRYSPGARSY